MKTLILSLIFLIASLSTWAQNSGIQQESQKTTDTTAVNSEPVIGSKAIPIIGEKSTFPVPAEVQLADPKSNSGIKEED